jgi:DNA-directed RNA polymerase specialized sigma24 family protein
MSKSEDEVQGDGDPESLDGSFGAEFPGTKNRKFPTTHWSFIVNARSEDSESASRGLGNLCRTYWYPLYAYVRKKGYSSHDAQDLTQEFFADLLARRTIEQADESRGKFRSYLLSSLNHFLINDWKSKTTKKRGGQEVPISIEAEQAENRFKHEPVDKLTPEKIYERSWALAVLNTVLAELEKEYSSKRKEVEYTALSQFLSWNSGDESYHEVAERQE